jgi:hypothetical protein
MDQQLIPKGASQMVWILIYYLHIQGGIHPQQMPHEYASKAECENAASIIDAHDPYNKVQNSTEHVCVGVSKTR